MASQQIRIYTSRPPPLYPSVYLPGREGAYLYGTQVFTHYLIYNIDRSNRSSINGHLFTLKFTSSRSIMRE